MKAFEKDFLKCVFKRLRARFKGVCESMREMILKRVFKRLRARFVKTFEKDVLKRVF